MQLEVSGQPISDDRKKAIVEVLVSERKRVPDPSEIQPLRTRDDLERYFAWMEDYDRRVSEDLSTVLSPTQLGSLKEFPAVRTANRQVALKETIEPRLAEN